MPEIKIALAQINFTLGDLAGNSDKIIQAALSARDKNNAAIVVFSELSLTGYPPEDILLLSDTDHKVQQALTYVITAVKDICIIVGYPQTVTGKRYNMAGVFYNGKLLHQYAKQFLPNYLVFDEQRYFCSGSNNQPVFEYAGTKLGLLICEDIWQSEYVTQVTALKCDLIICLNASPFVVGRNQQRRQYLCQLAQDNKVAIVYVNAIGGQDALVFDGNSMALDNRGNITAQAAAFKEDIIVANIGGDNYLSPQKISPSNQQDTKMLDKMPEIAEIYSALVLSLRDYITKNNFSSVVLGLSGGIDSAVVATLAAASLGNTNVTAVMLPTIYTSATSLTLAAELATNLKLVYKIHAIDKLVCSNLEQLDYLLDAKPNEIVKQNIQARIRANLLMSLSNQTGSILLTTGNKSELAMGYTTLYGDMAGGFNPLKNLYKTQVYALAEYCNTIQKVIPLGIITRPPSAELAHHQQDSDNLPPYALLDDILIKYMEHNSTPQEIKASGCDMQTVTEVIKKLHLNEHKRQQAALGTRISNSSFGKDWRYPISKIY